MARTRLALLLALSALSCQSVSPHKTLTADPTLLHWHDRFFSEFGIVSHHVTLTFSRDLEETKLGSCSRVQNTTIGYVRLNLWWWDYLSDLEKEQLVYHELLHCAAQAEHNSDVLDDGCPASIMFPYLMNDTCYSTHKQHYVKEFKR